MKYRSTRRTPSPELLEELESLLDQLDPDLGYPMWIQALMAVFNETCANLEGFEIVNEWSSRGNKYKGRDDVWKYWKGFNLHHEKLLLKKSLYRMVSQA